MKGCGCKFVYHSEEHGAIVLRCGKWKEVSKIGSHSILKFCYDCLDVFYEKYLQEVGRDENR